MQSNTKFIFDFLLITGWMYHVVDGSIFGVTRQQKLAIAIHCLQESIKFEPKSGQSLYLLGRCLAASGQVHDAFVAYRLAYIENNLLL